MSNMVNEPQDILSANATLPDAGSFLNSKSLQYFLALYPLMMSMGISGGIMGAIYVVYGIIHQKITSKLYCQVSIKYDDDTFKWVNKYMKDKGHIRDDS